MFVDPQSPSTVTGQTLCLLVLKVNTARKTVNRKRFFGEHERTVNGFACRSILNSNGTVLFPGPVYHLEFVYLDIFNIIPTASSEKISDVEP
ncbi:MAG: hypothetical protein FWC60_08160 [Firmicutes bacterium]|nr:hypothetical protein [Bacillota bacterium]